MKTIPNYRNLGSSKSFIAQTFSDQTIGPPAQKIAKMCVRDAEMFNISP